LSRPLARERSGGSKELALGDDDGAMDAAGADLAALLQAGGNRLEEAVAGFRRQWLAGEHDGGQFIVGKADGLRHARLSWRKGAQGLACGPSAARLPPPAGY
jgi:hypothetical protein